jgi:NAD+ kinase
MKIAIHGRSFTEETQPYVQALFDILKERQADFSCSASFYSFLLQSGVNPHTEKTYPHPHGAPDADFIFSIGGDGTLLESVMQARSRQILFWVSIQED